MPFFGRRCRDYKRETTVLLLLLAITVAKAQFTSSPSGPFVVGATPQAMAIADFNGDGKPDIVTANFAGNNITILLGNGSGGFSPAPGSPVAVGTNPQSAAVGDVNGDGKPDIITANLADNTVTVLLGDGTGGFSQATGSPFTVGSSPVFVATGDFNGDGKLDIAAANSASNNLTVLLGDGSGGFSPAPGNPFAVGNNPQSVATGDFNGDGRLDVAIANLTSNDVTVLLGDGSGAFTSATSIPVGFAPVSVAAGDLNGDGKPDIVTANSGDNTITVLLGDGSGGFTPSPASPFTAGSQPSSVVLGDFNGDGQPDIAATNQNDGTVSILLGYGSGSFTTAGRNPLAIGASPLSLAVGDFNLDGKPDLAAVNPSANSLTLLLNTLPAITVNPVSLALYGTAGKPAAASLPVSVSSSTSGATYAASATQPWLMPAPASNATGGVTSIALSASPAALAAGVYTGVVRYTAPNFFDAATNVTFNVATQSGSLAQAAASPYSVGVAPYSVAAGDFNGDGNPDIITANAAANNVILLLGDGAGGFTAAAGSPFPVGAQPASIAVADFNGDGKPDVAVANSGDGTVSILLGDGAGGLAPAAGSPLTVGANPQSVLAGDFNGDGQPDIVTANNGSNNLTVLLGNGVGGFMPAPGSPIAAGTGPQSIASGDFNRDGRLDIAVIHPASHTVAVLLGNGSGGFILVNSFSVGLFSQSLAVGDFNSDGKPDVVSANSGSASATVLLGDGTGNLGTGHASIVGSSPQAVAVGDFNGDGKLDIATANGGDGTVTVLLGNGSGSFTPASGSPFSAGSFPAALAVADFNGDGRADIAIANTGDGTVTVLLGGVAATSSALGTTAGASIVYGAALPLTLTVTQPSGGFSVPTGTVTFLDGGIAIGTTTQSGNPFTFSATGLTGGSHTLTATYDGDAANAPSSSNTISVTVTLKPQTITFTALSKQLFGAAPFTVIATASSHLPVGFTSTTTAVCTVSGALVTTVSTGSCTLQAAQPGDSDYGAAAAVNQTFTVAPGTQTITFGALPNQAIGIGSVSVSATASSGLTVSFSSATASVCTVSGALVTLVAMGTCTVQATQAGNSTYAAAASVSQHFLVTAQSQTLAFAALSTQLVGAAPFSVSATASSGLTVNFTSSTAAVCTVSGALVTLVSAGKCTIVAAQAGNTTYAAATPVPQSFTVTQASQTISFGSLIDQAFGTAPFPVTATASSGLAVTFTSTTTPVCTVAKGTITLVATGTCAIQAAQAGNSGYSAAAPVIQSFNVEQASQIVTFAALADKMFGAASFTVTAKASSGLAVSFASASQSTCTVSGASVTLAAVGTCTIQATQAGNNNYGAAPPVPQGFQITQASQTITFTAPSARMFGATPFTLKATASSGLAVTFASATQSTCTVSGATVTLAAAGACTIQASQPGNTNYAAATAVPQSLTVAPASQTITFAALSNQAFGAAPFNVNATASSGLSISFASTTTAVCTVSAAVVTLVSTGTCTLQASQPGNSNYAAAPLVSQSFTIGVGALNIGAVLNAGSYATGAIAPNGFTVVYGSNFSTATAQTASATLPTTLAGATVSIKDSKGATQKAQLDYVSPPQINLVVPNGLASGPATITITNVSGNTGSFATTIAPISPALFTADSSGAGVAAAIAIAYANGKSTPQVLPVFSCSSPPLACTPTPIGLNPSSESVYLELYGTGIRGRSGLTGVSVTLGGTALHVTYAGAQGTYTGLDQVNVLLDPSLIGKGELTLQLTVDSVMANSVTIRIR